MKEYGKGVDKMCRELEVNGSMVPTFHADDFILKVTVAKVTENTNRVTEKVTEKLEKVTEKAINSGETLTGNRLDILRLIIEDPYISKSELSKTIGISYTSISRNIETMRGKYLRRVGPDKGGFWEIIE